MDRIIYDRMAELDTEHWWYCARRDILETLIRRKFSLPCSARLLEIGCGTGHNLKMLSRFGVVEAIELDDAARLVAEDRLGKPIGRSPLPELTDVGEGLFDLIAVLDVIEHVEDDLGSLRVMARKLRVGGRILITVPAHPWMWSAHDVANHHKRRYTARTLRSVIEQAGLKVELLSPFNSLLFPLAAIKRLADRLTGKEGSDDAMPFKPVNRIFQTVFSLERHMIGRVPFPPGLSLVAIASPGT